MAISFCAVSKKLKNTRVNLALPAPDFDLTGLAVNLSLAPTAAPAKAATGRKRPPAAVALGLDPRARYVAQVKRQARDLLTTTEAREHIVTLPRPGEALHLICGGEHTALDLICACQELLGRPVTLTAATLSMNLGNAQRLLEMLDAGKLRSVALLVSEYFAASDTDQYQLIRERMTARGQRLVATRTHAKVALISAERPRIRLVIEGSGNLRSCSRIEQATIINDAGLFTFHQRWINQLLDTHP